MLMYPSVRKGLITEPSTTTTTTTAPTPSFYLSEDSVHILQDDLALSDRPFDDSSLQCYQHQPLDGQSQLLSPFQHQQQQQNLEFHFNSPPSSAPSSPIFSSPASSFSNNAVATDYNTNSFLDTPSMTPSSSYNPSIQIQQPTSPHYSQQCVPSQNQQQPYFFDDASMLAHQNPVANNPAWDSHLQLLSPAHIPHGLSRMDSYPESQQKAASPNSSVSPGGSVKSIHRNSNSAATSKPLPTPVQTPVQNSFLASSFNNYDPSSQDGAFDAEMRRAIMEQPQHKQQAQQSHQHQRSDHSLAPSVSTLSHNSPVTPQNSFDELDDASKAIANGEDLFPEVDKWMDEYLQLDPRSDYNGHGNATHGTGTVGIPKLNRTISDIYQDELYNTAIMPGSQFTKKPSMNQQMLNPYRNVFADRLQAANQANISARSHSPGMNINRERSPFRQNAPLAAEYNPGLQQSTSMPMAQNGVNMNQTSTNATEPKTISPKDALLDFNEGEDPSMPPLFSSNQSDFNLGDALGQLRRESSSSFRPSQSFSTNSMETYPNQYATAGMPQQFPFATPQAPQQDRRSSQQQAQTNNLLQQTPEFPASLPSLESTGSEGFVGTEMSPPEVPQPKTKESISRPQNTTADSGTYTCTYHGCSHRFETPGKLQKHKREAHRQTTPGGHLLSRDTSAAARNSQAGPHKCERVNPSTGKPCNSVFSRPYDLTRHEDTIHNARKQKVRCHLCTEEKSFSRNDALTRHMRVVHPEVDWPGKQRRRGGRD